MAGANNKSFKAAGLPKKTIDTIRVETGGRLSLRSAIQIASGRGLPLGKAAKHEEAQRIQSLRNARAANRQPTAEAGISRLRNAASRAPYSAVVTHPSGETRRVIAGSGKEFEARVATAKASMEANAKRKAAAAPPKPAWAPKGRQNTPERAREMAAMLHEGTAAVRAAGTPEKGMVHVYNTESKKVVAVKALSTKGGAVVVQSPTRKASHAPTSFHVIHRGTGIGVSAFYRTRTEAAEAAAGLAKSLDRTVGRMKSGDVRAGEALYRYSVKKRGQIMSQPSPQEKRAATRQAAKEAQAAKDKAFQEKWRASSEARDARKLRVAQRLTDMIRKAKDSMATAHRAVYDASVHVKKHGTGPLHQAEAQHAMAMARVKHLEGRAKRLGIEPTRQYRHAAELHFR
jgi:hypothetical protein